MEGLITASHPPPVQVMPDTARRVIPPALLAVLLMFRPVLERQSLVVYRKEFSFNPCWRLRVYITERDGILTRQAINLGENERIIASATGLVEGWQAQAGEQDSSAAAGETAERKAEVRRISEYRHFAILKHALVSSLPCRQEQLALRRHLYRAWQGDPEDLHEVLDLANPYLPGSGPYLGS